MYRFRLGTVISAIAILIAFMAVAYLVGAASASDGYDDPTPSFLESLRRPRETNLFNRAMKIIENNYVTKLSQEDKEMLTYGALHGLVNSLHDEPFNDRFSNFYDPELYEELSAVTTGHYAGIGILMGYSSDGMYPEVVNVFPDTPAESTGMESDDIISEIDGEDTFGMDLQQVAVKIKGEPGSTVDITVYRPAIGDTVSMTITRQFVEVSSIEDAEMLDGNIGYIKISSFAEDTGEAFRDAMEQLEAQGVEGLVIDLRGNTGGLFDAAIDVAECFLDDQVIVSVVGRDRQNEFVEYYARPQLKKYHLPIVVIQDSGSASASEILTGALKDNNLAKVVGETSFGKGVVQAVYSLENKSNSEMAAGEGFVDDPIKSALAITIGKYYTPNNTDIHGKGIDPDIWYDINNQMVENPELAEIDDRINEKREEIRQLWAEIRQLIREGDAVKERALEVALQLVAGEDVPDVPKLEIEEDHVPIAASTPGGQQDGPEQESTTDGAE